MKQEKLNYSNLTTLPNNFLAEQAILNILLTNSFLVSKVSTKLKPETFYFEPHRILYEIFCTLDEEQIRVNPTNVITRLQDQALLKKIGGIECVVSVVDRFENFSDLDHYITQVNEKYLRRLIIQFGKQSIADGYTTSEKIEAILNRLEQSFLGLNQENLSQKVYTAAEILDDVYLEMKSKIENKSNFAITS
jgi:replicative DNA helicase